MRELPDELELEATGSPLVDQSHGGVQMFHGMLSPCIGLAEMISWARSVDGLPMMASDYFEGWCLEEDDVHQLTQ